MLIKVTAPALSGSDSVAKLGKWNKQVGEAVVKDEALVEIEEQKSILDIVAPADGTIVEILKNEGDEIGSEDVLFVLNTERSQADGIVFNDHGQGKSQPDSGYLRGKQPDYFYDVVVIGAGPAGYAAAIRCAQLGLKTACVDRRVTGEGRPALGGTCLNVGCIPSKALLDSSHRYHELLHQFPAHGIRFQNAEIDVSGMLQRKSRIVETLNAGIQGLFRKHQIKQFTGVATFVSPGRVQIAPINESGGQTQEVDAKHVIIATGSLPVSIPAAVVDNDSIVDSTGAMNFSSVPPRLGVIGAGAIGLELGSVWNRLGSQVVLLEAADEFLGAVDSEIAFDAFKAFKKQGLDIRLGTTVTEAMIQGDGVLVRYKSGGALQSLIVDKLIVSVGRRPCTADLGGEVVGINVDAQGFITVDEHNRTNLENIYAIGDVVRGPMLAHRGSKEGVVVAERIAGRAEHIGIKAIPWVIYTWPEIAWVGQSEESLNKQGINYRSGVFPLKASGRALASGETIGKVKILVDRSTDRLLGVHVFAAQASELIAEGVLAITRGGDLGDLMHTVHAHPTLSETVHEAALAAYGMAVHV